MTATQDPASFVLKTDYLLLKTLDPGFRRDDGIKMGKFFADIVAVIHGFWVLIVIIGPLISWKWRSFRWIHLVMMATTLLIMISGQYCPLTILEQDLREAYNPTAGFETGFIENYVTKVIHVEFSPWYIFFGLLGWFGTWYAVYVTKWESKK